MRGVRACVDARSTVASVRDRHHVKDVERAGMRRLWLTVGDREIRHNRHVGVWHDLGARGADEAAEHLGDVIEEAGLQVDGAQRRKRAPRTQGQRQG